MVLKTELTGRGARLSVCSLTMAIVLLSTTSGRSGNAQSGTGQPATAQTAPDFPAKDWQMVSPESEGYSSKKLEALRAWLAAGPTTAMVIVVHGHIIFSYGDTAKVSKIASVRKSIL